jgi:hypothetical protein
MTVIATTESDGRNSTSRDVRETLEESLIEPGCETVTAPDFVPPLKTPTKKNLEAGAVAEIKDLYKKGKASCSCCITWASELQKKLPTTAITDTDGYAILARKTKGHGDFGRELKLHSIVIQSALIREVLDEVLKGYRGALLGLLSSLDGAYECLCCFCR